MTAIHKEISFEAEICAHLGQHGWLYEEGAASRYDRARALFPEDLFAWIEAAQPKAWEKLEGAAGAALRATLLDRLRKELDRQGSLDVLRHGIDLIGVPGRLKLAEFKPALADNAEIVARYRANRLRAVRQVRYSLAGEDSLDLVLFLNGIPVATAELKTDFTQSVEDAVDQYRFDRPPRPQGQAAEPLLHFPSGAVVHFAVSNSEVWMTTRLAGKETVFLPFNRGDEQGGKGNPANPKGHKTAYLWEEVWARESWLQLIGRYVIAERDKKKQLTKLIFPRYHQLDATRRLVAAVLAEGAGQKYLIQHSAGSGKTNSIAWTAHFLADLHDGAGKKLFDTVIVVSDRRVIDGQLQNAIFGFERTAGVVATIKGEGGSKSAELAEALAGAKKIVVCTIQTFPFALQEIQTLAATKGKTFAVIADEAHSSQTGEAATRLKEVLSAEEMQALGDGGEVGTEDLLAAQMKARADAKGITYIAFTATPKAKTMELFGRPPDPALPAGPGNLPLPFHVYSMRQAIEEGFILDVLRNYTPYDLALKLSVDGREIAPEEVDRDAAMRALKQWVQLHPHNIAQKVRIVVEHFRANVAQLLDGRAKAMVVLASRREAVRWQLAMAKYIADKGYPIGTLVAFSGEVSDPESGPEPFTETSKALNPGLKGSDIAKAFAGPGFQILLVANKYQTGFDQPLLCAMYVDRRLAGVQAVQTLSRLNRAHPGKDTTFVVDFVNSAAEVLAAFQTYYETAEMEATTDPYLVLDLKAKLDGSGWYDEHEVERVVRAEMDPKAKQSDLVAAIMPVADRMLKAFAAEKAAMLAAIESGDAAAENAAREAQEALLLVRADMASYHRTYTFLSQIFDYGNTAVEKRAIFYRRLVPLLEFGREREDVDVSKVKLTHYKLKTPGSGNLPLGLDDRTKLKPYTATGSGAVREPEKVLLEQIVEKMNELFDGELTDADQLVYVNEVLKGKLMENGILVDQARHNTKEQFANSPDLQSAITDAIMDAFAAHEAMSRQALNSEQVRAGLKDILLGPAQLWESLRGSADPAKGARP